MTLVILCFCLQVFSQQILSLEEKYIFDKISIICLIKPCNSELLQYRYGQETFGNLYQKAFALTFLIKFFGSPYSFIASLEDNELTILELNSQYVFGLTDQAYSYYNQSQNFNTDAWYQIVITQIKIQVCDHSQCFSSNHNHAITSLTTFNILNHPATDFTKIKACCIMMYKGITYPNNNQITFYNTKYPEAVIDINIQEKQQSNITFDHSDYQYVIKLGEQFSYDQYDPYLMDDGLLFNGSQYMTIDQITLNNQSTFEFRIQRSNSFTSNIILLIYKYYHTNLEIQIILNGQYVIYKFNTQMIQFQLQIQDSPQTHFSIGVIQFYDQSLQKIYFIQYSNSDHISIQTQTITQRWDINNGYGYLRIGSNTNQFNSGDYFVLYHFRQYQGFFFDDQQVMKSNCKIYLNDRCIICHNGYILSNNHNCQQQCDNSTSITTFVQSHNQCLRYCHPKCATCNNGSPQICLTCYGNRMTPPDCNCPSEHFEDNVSPNCRKYYPDVSVQTGIFTMECDGSSGYQDFSIYYDFTYTTIPQVVYSHIGAKVEYQNSAYILNYYKSDAFTDHFVIRLWCNGYHFYVINWMSSVGKNIPNNFDFGSQNTQSDVYLVDSQQQVINGENLNPIFYVNGWEYQVGVDIFYIRQTLSNSTHVAFSSLSGTPFNVLYYVYFYTNFKTYPISDLSLNTQLDNQPKSIKSFIVQRGFSITIYDRFIYLPYQRYSNYYSIKSKYQKPMEIYDWLLIMASQKCTNNGPCDFYESYDFNCNKQLSFCAYFQAPANYFVNDKFYFDKCHQTCKTCTGNAIDQCTSCYSEQNMTLKINKCIYNCDLRCLTCDDAVNTTCLSCGSYSNLINNKCICDPGYYFNTNQCSQCAHQCQTCSSYDICLTCSGTLVKNVNTCKCPNNAQYYSLDNICHNCHLKCQTCVNNLFCTSCVDIRHILEQGDCLCPQGYYQDSSYFCQPCQQFCQICVGFDNCNQCKNNLKLFGNQCVCQNNQYLDENQYCQNCSSECKTCDGPLSNQCLSCSDDRQLKISDDSSKCLCLAGYYEILDTCQGIQNLKQACSSNCLECVSQNSCTICKTNQQLVNGKCLCQEGFYESNEKCFSCDTIKGRTVMECNYMNCHDQIWTPSEQCDDGNEINNDGCTHCQIDKNYKCLNRLNQKSICFQCKDYCKDCFYYKNQIICNECHEGYYLIDNKCQQCSINCKTCVNHSKCLSCPIVNTYPDQQYKCQQCEHGQYLTTQNVSQAKIQLCQTLCGDGILSEHEQCDDGNMYSNDGCSNQCLIEDSFVCITIQGRSECFISQQPEFIIMDTIKISDRQYQIQMKSNQKLISKLLIIQVLLVSANSYEYTYEIEQTQNTWDYLTINITMIFTTSFKYERFQIQINEDIQNIYGKTLNTRIFYKEFENVVILSDAQKQVSELGSQLGSILFYITLSLTLLQLLLGGVSSISVMVKTQNYIYFMKYMNIDFPPNLKILFGPFNDLNIIKFINLPNLILKTFNIEFTLPELYKNADYNHYQINANFIRNIFPFIVSICQAVLLIELTKIITQIIQKRISVSLDEFTYKSKQMKFLRFILFYLLKQIKNFKQNGILELSLISQYQIYFAILLQLKTFEYNLLYDNIQLIATLLFSIFWLKQILFQVKSQISLISLFNQFLFVFSIVYVNNFQLIQLLFISVQQLVQLLLQCSQNKFQNVRTLIEESSLLILFFTSILYVYSPIDIDYIHVGFIQFGAILVTFSVDMIFQISESYGQITKYFQSIIKQKH